MTQRLWMASIVGMTLTLSACSSADDTGADDTGGPGELSASGPITGGAVPADAEVVVMWTVSSGSPDYSYKFGDGSLAGATFTIGLSSDPPVEAINSYGVGIGLVVLLDPGTTLPEGKVDFDVIEPAVLGLSAQHALIWRDPSRPGLEWSADFPEGMSCGQCVPATDDFDSYKPVACTAVEVQVSSNLSRLEVCDWT